MSDKRGHVTTRLARGKSLDLGPDRTDNIRDCCVCVVWCGKLVISWLDTPQYWYQFGVEINLHRVDEN